MNTHDLLPQLQSRTPTPYERVIREALAQYLRAHEHLVFRPSPRMPTVALRDALGWSDEALHDFIASDCLLHTSPHASMNVFFPRLGVTWLQTALQEHPSAPSGIAHLRTHLTHNNVSDLGWRPYAWWHRRMDDELLHKQVVVSRNKKRKHRIVYAVPIPEFDRRGLSDDDRRGLDLASHTTNLAYFSIVYSAHIESRSGFNSKRRTTYVPFDVLHAFYRYITQTRAPTYADQRDAVTVLYTRDTNKRYVNTTGELAPCPPDGSESDPVFTLSNEGNFVATYLLGLGATTGGKKMRQYLPDVDRLADAVEQVSGHRLTRPTFIEIRPYEYEQVVSPLPSTRDQLFDSGLPYSMTLAHHEHGDLPAKLHGLLGRAL